MTLAAIPGSALALAQSTAARLSEARDLIPISTPDQEEKIALLLRAIATVRRQADDERKAAKAPILEQSRALDAAYKAPDSELARVEAMLRAGLSAAKEARERARMAALDAARTAALAGDAAAANAAMIEADPVFAPIEGVAERWTWEVAGVQLDLVPREYLALDLPKVRAEIASAVKAGREPSVPGISFERKANLIVRKIT